MYTLIAAIALAPMELLSFQLGAVGITPTEALLAAAGLSWAANRLVERRGPVGAVAGHLADGGAGAGGRAGDRDRRLPVRR